MPKIVINKCHGGFGLSHKAVMRYLELKGWDVKIELDEFCVDIFKRHHPDDEVTIENLLRVFGESALHYYVNGEYFSPYDIPRDDPDLIRVVEELGEEANGKYAELKIVEIPDDVEWVIQEYDGYEWVAEKHRTWG